MRLSSPNFGTSGRYVSRNGEPTYDNKYTVHDGYLTNAPTKGEINILRKEGRGKHVQLVLTKRYENC